MAEEVLRFEGVGLRYGARAALAGVDLVVRRGERVALVGPSGAGKSTLLALATGGLAPSEGRVAVLGLDLGGLAPRALRAVQRRVGTVHQDFRLVESLSVLANVLAGRLGRWSTARAVAALAAPRADGKVLAALERVGLADRLHERVDALSGGERQRVAIARVLVQDPELVLADEPIASLDPERGRDVLRLLTEIVAERGATLLLSLHDPPLARRACERVVGLRAGRVVLDRPSDGLHAGELEALYALDGP